MIRGSVGASLFLRAMGEATKKFGKVTDDNRELVTKWVQRRVNELRDGPSTRDAKAAAAGRDE